MRTLVTVVVLAILVGCNAPPQPVQAYDCRIVNWYSETKKSGDGVSLWNGIKVKDAAGQEHMASVPYADLLRYKAKRGQPYVGVTDDGKCQNTPPKT